jgi:hypothetical protein
LVPEQSDLFRQTFLGIERNRTGGDALYQLQLKSQENLILGRILRAGVDLPFLMKHFGDSLAEPLARTNKNLEAARRLWDSLVQERFEQLGRGLPDWPAFVEIQEGLEIYQRTPFHRFQRRLNKAWQRQTFRIVYLLSRSFPSWKWVARRQCYLESALSDEYETSMSDICQWAIQ